MNTSNLSKYNIKELTDESQRNLFGGVVWWIPVAIGIVYDEIDDIWESGGDNLREAYEAGQDYAKNNL
jgi:hypothetical protein